MNFINQMEPWFDAKEIDAVKDYMSSGGWLTEFKKTSEFERLIADYVGSKYCSVVSNGTVSLFIALRALGVVGGDEVIVPDYTMVATPNSVVLAGARPVFVDVKREDLCMDFSLLKKAVTKKTKAVILVTINGRYPKEMDEFVSFCKSRNIYLIEDAAQSLGSKKGGRHLGTFGVIGSFSFSVPKIITTGQGGALVTDDGQLFEKIKKIKDFGRSKGGVDYYETMGWNFKFTDLQSVIGIEQMKKLEWRVERKKEMYRLYHDMLSRVDEIELIPTNLNDTPPWFIDVLVPDPRKLQNHLKENNIGSRSFYPPIHSQPPYNLKGSFPVTEDISSKGLWLPSSSFLTDEDIKLVCDRIRSYFNH